MTEEDEAFCTNCEAYTMHTRYTDGHDTDTCHECGWIWTRTDFSGMSGEYNPPLEMENDS